MRAAGNRLYVLYFALALALYAWLTASHWNAPLLGEHSFRETQTAISVRSLLEGASFPDYETPVLGKPWAIPFEFPVYHAAVATTVRWAGMPLDQAGRLVSLLAFFLSLVPLYFVIGEFCPDPLQRLVPLSLVLVSPLYVFWSSAFLIESTALLFGLTFFAAIVRFARNGHWAAFIIALASAIASALAKGTTFIVWCVPAGVVFLLLSWRARRIIGAAVIVAIALIVFVKWNAHADALKQLNPMADFITSAGLNIWNFGTLQQRLSPRMWIDVFRRILPELTGRPILVYLPLLPLIGFAAFRSRAYRVPALIALATFVAPLFLFTNLYATHNYYFYANGIALIVFGACGIFAMLEYRLVQWLVIPLLIVLMFCSYWRTSYGVRDVQHEHNFLQFAHAIEQGTAPRDVLVIYGRDWDSTLPYYAHRRALMDRWDMPVGTPRLAAAMAKLQGERIGAMIVTGSLAADESFIASHAQYFGVDAQPAIRSPEGNVYFRR